MAQVLDSGVTAPEPPTTPPRAEPGPQDFLDMQASPEFAELRHRLRRFVFPVTAFFLVWYGTYVLLAMYVSI